MGLRIAYYWFDCDLSRVLVIDIQSPSCVLDRVHAVRTPPLSEPLPATGSKSYDRDANQPAIKQTLPSVRD